MGYLLGGGVVITDKSRAAIIKKTMGSRISVAVKVKVSTLAAVVLSLSLR
jgi:isopentenyl phosphate kinase